MSENSAASSIMLSPEDLADIQVILRWRGEVVSSR
jgi:hypothetical protein